MSSSLSSVPSDTSPWRVPSPPTTSELRGLDPLPTLPLPAFLPSHDPFYDINDRSRSECPAESSNNTAATITTKRRRISTEYLAPPSPERRSKRVREATPIVDDESTSQDRGAEEAMRGASAPTLSTAPEMDGGDSSFAPADECEAPVVPPAGSNEGREEGEGEGSVLFSEQVGEPMDGEGPGQGDDEDGGDFKTEATVGVVDATTGNFLPEDYDGAEAAKCNCVDGADEDGEDSEEEEGVAEEDAFNPETDEGVDDDGDDVPLALRGGPSRQTDGDRMSRYLERTQASVSSRGANPCEEVYLDGEEDEEEDIVVGSYHSGDTIEYEMDHRPVLERTAVKRDIRQFTQGLKTLINDTGGWRYRVVDRLGEGTFSSVYLAEDCLYNQLDNNYWSNVPNNADKRQFRVPRSDIQVALKKILVTSSPQRIENELHILECLRGCRNVSQLITAFREEDQVIIVLPYHRSDDFRHFYRHMDPAHVKLYMRSLLRALKDTHHRGIVHRDVKPANFLFDYESGQGVLCDFGLAERYMPPRKATCQHGPASLEALQGNRCKTNDTPTVEQSVYDARKRGKLGEGRVGFLQDDKRPAIKTNRAGTRGFRAPEVLLKCPDQTVAIDVWSAGIMLLSILTHKFPVFNSSDDTESLMEIAAIFGRAAMERCAMLHNRTIISNVPTLETAPLSLERLILKLNPHIYTPPLSHPSSEDAKAHIEDIDQCIDLCGRLLRLDPTKRLTADAALRHAFLSGEPEEPISGVFLNGTEGKCGRLHTIEGGKHIASFSSTLLEMQFGQGVPPSRDELCAEHEHWQERIGFNPLVVCRRIRPQEASDTEGFDEMEEDGEQEYEEDDGKIERREERARERTALGEKSLNVRMEGGERRLAGLGRFVKA